MDMEGINVVVPTSSSYSCSSTQTSNLLQKLCFAYNLHCKRKKEKEEESCLV
jgi:hypothetical protein